MKGNFIDSEKILIKLVENELRKENSLIILWISGHNTVEGNEVTDKLAKKKERRHHL